jgi:hypothetical protein
MMRRSRWDAGKHRRSLLPPMGGSLRSLAISWPAQLRSMNRIPRKRVPYVGREANISGPTAARSADWSRHEMSLVAPISGRRECKIVCSLGKECR